MKKFIEFGDKLRYLLCFAGERCLIRSLCETFDRIKNDTDEFAKVELSQSLKDGNHHGAGAKINIFNQIFLFFYCK